MKVKDAKQDNKANAAAGATAPAAVDPSEAKAKDLRKARKKLRQIDDLAEKKASGADLTAEQEQKLTTRAGLAKQIDDLEKS